MKRFIAQTFFTVFVMFSCIFVHAITKNDIQKVQQALEHEPEFKAKVPSYSELSENQKEDFYQALLENPIMIEIFSHWNQSSKEEKVDFLDYLEVDVQILLGKTTMEKVVSDRLSNLLPEEKKQLEELFKIMLLQNQ